MDKIIPEYQSIPVHNTQSWGCRSIFFFFFFSDDQFLIITPGVVEMWLAQGHNERRPDGESNQGPLGPKS